MILPAYLLLAIALLGAADIALFHTRAHRLREHREARAELVTHFLRGPTYCALFVLVPNFTFHGFFVHGLFALYAFDLAISLADFWLEPESRRALGGLPRGEYLLHVLLAMLFGALVMATWHETAGNVGSPSELRFVPIESGWHVRAALALMAPVVLWTGILDLRAVTRLRRPLP